MNMTPPMAHHITLTSIWIRRARLVAQAELKVGSRQFKLPTLQFSMSGPPCTLIATTRPP